MHVTFVLFDDDPGCVETSLVTKIAYFLNLLGWFIVGKNFVQLHLCIEVSFLNFYFAHIQKGLF